MPETGPPYEDTKKLPVPVDAAWEILTCQAGARLWLSDEAHPGVRIGAAFPVRGGRAAEITAVHRRKSVELCFPSGRRAVLEFHYAGEGQSKLLIRKYSEVL